MLRGAVTAISAMALAVVPVMAQAAPVPASRAPAVTEDGESLSTTGWVLGAIGLGLLIWGIIELTDDDKPQSP